MSTRRTRSRSRSRGQAEPSDPMPILVAAAWLLAVPLSVFALPGMVLPAAAHGLARVCARRPRGSGRDRWTGAACPAGPVERRREAAWRRLARWPYGNPLPVSADMCPPLAFAAFCCLTQPLWAWPFQFAAAWLCASAWIQSRRDVTLRADMLEWNMRRRRVPWARKNMAACLLAGLAGVAVSLPLDMLVGRVEPSLIMLACAGLPMVRAHRQAAGSFRLDLECARLIHQWAGGDGKPATPSRPGRVHDARRGGDGSLLFLMDVANARAWTADGVRGALAPCAQRDGMLLGLVLDGADLTRVMVACTPAAHAGVQVADGIALEAALTVDETRACMMYGALPGRIVRLKTVARRDGKPAVWSFSISGSNADWEMIGRDWLKGATQEGFEDWGVPYGLRIIADVNANHGWVTDADGWDGVQWDMNACRGLMADRPTREHDDPGYYLTMIGEDARQHALWQGALAKTRLDAPSTIDHDSRRPAESPDGWVLETTRLLLPATGVSVGDYQTVDLRPAFGEAYVADVLPVRDRTGWHTRMLLFALARRKDAPWNARIPGALRDLTGAGDAHALLARILVSRACATVLKRPALVGNATQLAADRAWTMWRMPVELGDGVTADDVRRAQERLKSAMGADRMLLQWADAGRVVLWAGVAPPDGARWLRERDRLMYERLVLDDAWAQSGARGADGRPPQTADIGDGGGRLLRVSFVLPAGLGVEDALKRLDAFRATSGYLYARRATGPGLTLLLAHSDPIPERVDTDWRLLRGPMGDTRLPFATGDDGGVVAYDPHDTAHLLITGMTMSGKSSAAVTLVCGMLLRGWTVLVADPVKHAGDFTSIRDRLAGVADGLNETAAMLAWVMAENDRRKRLQASLGVEDYDRIPEGERPPRIGVFLDEFNRTLERAPKPRPANGDPDVENENVMNAYEDGLRARIGSLTGRLLKEARSQGITVILGAQQLNATQLDLLPAGSKNMLGRLFVGGGNPAGNVSVNNEAEANRLIRQMLSAGGMPRGRALYERMGRGVTMVQCWYSGKGGQLADGLKDVPVREPVDWGMYLQAPPRLFGAVPQDTGESTDAPVVVDDMDWEDMDWDEEPDDDPGGDGDDAPVDGADDPGDPDAA